jgi:hypothetical protein
MTIFLILAPYGAFATLMLLASATVSLATAAAISLATVTLDVIRGRSIKLLPSASAIVFAGVAAYLNLVDPALGSSKVKLAVDAGIFAISLGSMLIRHPFTLQYALEAVPSETAAMPGFLRANYIITLAWTLAALLMMLSNMAVLYVPGLPIWLTLAVAFAARNSAVAFTKWYPAYRKMKYGTPPPNALPHPH